MDPKETPTKHRFMVTLAVDVLVPPGKEPPTEYHVGTTIAHELDCIALDSALGYEIDSIVY